MGPPWMRGEKGGPARLAGDKRSSQSPTVRREDIHGMPEDKKDGSVRHQDLIMHRVYIVVVLLYILTTVNLVTVIVNSVLFVYLFQE